ncbi:medium chain dehydrogenase/reductase family protein [Cerasicoccus frondis]|uniref:medium chain dehydrogenase/reductase family protein n=1 Tax=Cerasicoccus frondis TaxID=490090 RepID=UPI002852C12D|nr:medium chain dehydrogenase/reductase family protein [Cerasicoccus frondis]
MKNTTKAIVFNNVNEVCIQEHQLPECGPYDLYCETLYTFVSPGTELRVLSGKYSKPKDFPLVPGYSAIARVLEVGSSVSGVRPGDLISGRNPKRLPEINVMWGAQAAHHVYSTLGEDRPVLINTDKPLEYVIAEVSAISHRGVDAAGAKAEETAVVIGQGMIGAFSAAFLIERGCRVIVCDVNENRLEKAMERGAAAAVNMRESDALERLKFFLNGGADIVVESSGTSKGIETAFQLLRKKPQAYGADYKVEPIGFYGSDWPRLIVQANYIEDVSINPHSFFDGEGVTILTPADRGVEDRLKVVEYIRTGQIRADDYIDLVLPYSQAAEGYKQLENQEVSSVVFEWG